MIPISVADALESRREHKDRDLICWFQDMSLHLEADLSFHLMQVLRHLVGEAIGSIDQAVGLLLHCTNKLVVDRINVFDTSNGARSEE